jgi:ferredoxin
MIVAERKSIDEISRMIADYENVLVMGCNTCVAVCHTGGEKEANILAQILRMKAKMDGREQSIEDVSVERQCEKEFVDLISEKIKAADCLLSVACGIGPQTIVGMFPDKIVLPGVNTTFLGQPTEMGIWEERCGGCGNCVLHLTAGICPIVRCSKSMLNGPCGGSQNGKCEVGTDNDCAWQLIYDRLTALDRLEAMDVITPPKDWTTARHGGPRKMVREDLLIDDATQEGKDGKKKDDKKKAKQPLQKEGDK